MKENMSHLTSTYCQNTRKKKISYCQFSCHTFQASASSQCQKPALVEKCDKTGPNWLGNGQKGGEKCQCLFYTVVKMAICPSVGEKKR